MSSSSFNCSLARSILIRFVPLLFLQVRHGVGVHFSRLGTMYPDVETVFEEKVDADIDEMLGCLRELHRLMP